MNLEEFFPSEEVEKAKRIFAKFYDKLFLNSKIKEPDTLLLCIYMLCNKNKTSKCKYNETKELFVSLGRKEENFRKVVYSLSQKRWIKKIENKETLLSLEFEGLKRIKEILSEEVGVKTWLISGGEIYRGKRLFEEKVITKLKGEVKICDPYVSVATLDILYAIKNKVKVRLLTQEIIELEKFKRYIKYLSKEKPNLTINVKIHRFSKLHDRYILSESGDWSIGHSLKDLGKKDTIISELDSGIRDALNFAFEKRWEEAQSLEN